ncbi:MAG: pentapeptide repeat-containing protein [Lewinellaceae bacterium]|nr:pentapeptide repeat-containing protein [Saprospiraceae bacterium]MCB9336605.1 pentapeptide repeat-containing protein [Lewinellaceae bacterium]
MEQLDDDIEKRLRQLEMDNLRLRAELEARKAGQKASSGMGKFLTQSSTRLLAGRKLKGSVRKLFDELPSGKVSKDTIVDVVVHLVWRITRIGIFAIVAAMGPLLIMMVQTYILNRQNDKLEIQNQLLGRQNDRLDQQINLEEGNRRSSLIFFMSNIMDKIDDEMKGNTARSLSDPLVGRIVSLSQALRPYRYLENDSLTPRQLSPERGQLLFSLINSNLDEKTYDKIFARANFNYADLREANFTDAYLKGAKLADSYFYKANFDRANLDRADLSHAYLEEATFKTTKMDGANLSYANLRKSRMEDISITGGNLAFADMREVYLDGDFRNSNLEGVKVQEATITSVNLEGCYFRSLSWIDSLEFYHLKGLASLREYYEPMKEVDKKGFTSDTLYRLRLDPHSPVMRIVACNHLVEAIMESVEQVKVVKKQQVKEGKPLSLYPVSNPFGLEDLGIKKDSVYLYRLSSDQDDVATTVMWLQFDPKTAALAEIFPGGEAPRKLSFNRNLLQKLNTECQQAQ